MQCPAAANGKSSCRRAFRDRELATSTFRDNNNN